MDVPMYFVYRDGKYIDVAGHSFRDYFNVGDIICSPELFLRVPGVSLVSSPHPPFLRRASRLSCPVSTPRSLILRITSPQPSRRCVHRAHYRLSSGAVRVPPRSAPARLSACPWPLPSSPSIPRR